MKLKDKSNHRKFFKHLGKSKIYKPNIQCHGELDGLHLNENAYAPAEDCLAAMTGLPEIDLRQYERAGRFSLEQKLADLHQINEDNIFIENGSSEVLKHIFFSLSPDGTKILLPESGWGYHNSLVSLSRMSVDYYSLLMDKQNKHYRFDIDNLLEKIKNDPPDYLLIVTPNAFTGHLMSNEDLLRILDACRDKTMVIVDQAYTEFSYNDDIIPADIIKSYNNVIFSRSFSKFYALANLRIGYAVSHKDNIDYIKSYTSVFGVSGICQSIACKALENQSYYQKLKRKNHDVKNSFIDKTNTLRHFEAFHSEANFVLLKVKGLSTSEVLEKVHAGGIVLRDCSSLGLGNCIRVTIGEKKVMDQLFLLLKGIDAELISVS